MKRAFINGEFLNLADAKISIFDRGFLFGDAVYEVLPVYNGKAFFVEKHLERLFSNLKKIKIEVPELDWNELINRLIVENNGGDLQVYLHVTRGNEGVRKHDISHTIIPSVIAFTIHNPYPNDRDKEKGLKAKLVEDNRWLRCDIKSTSLIANILLNHEAVSEGYQTSILVRDKQVAEGSTTNVFLVSKDGIIKTPSLSNLCLPGITRQITIELISDLKWQLCETDITSNELLDAREVWITSTSKEIMPVIEINNRPVNDGKPGHYWRTINKLYSQLIS